MKDSLLLLCAHRFCEGKETIKTFFFFCNRSSINSSYWISSCVAPCDSLLSIWDSTDWHPLRFETFSSFFLISLLPLKFLWVLLFILTRFLRVKVNRNRLFCCCYFNILIKIVHLTRILFVQYFIIKSYFKLQYGKSFFSIY